MYDRAPWDLRMHCLLGLGEECDFFIDLVLGVSSTQVLCLLNTNLFLKMIMSN